MTQDIDFRRSVVYQIYPRSFADSNGDGVGDLPGIIQHLDYIADLGVTDIWLSPIYASPNDDNGYDISDYRAIMAEFGTLDDFDRLVHEAQKRGLRIIMDLVVNHTSDEHEWFQQSRSSRDNPYRDYYIWRDPSGYTTEGKPIPPNNWISCFSPSAWEWDEPTQQFYLHLFSTKQPDLNWDNPKVRAEVYDLMRFWLDRGVSGFRMDVINAISKDPEFPDDPRVTAGGRESSLYLIANGPRVHEFLREMRREVLDDYSTLTVGETPDTTVADGLAYAGFNRGELNMVFTFEHMMLDGNPDGYGKWWDGKVDVPTLKQNLAHWQEGLAGKAWNSLYWNNHDQPRVVSRFGDDSPQWRVTSATMLATTLHMMCGTPYIYQGEEIGMTNVAFPELSDYDDIEQRNAYAQYVDKAKIFSHEQMMHYIHARGRDNARTPMQWSATKNAGFSTGTPWLKINPNYRELNAERDVADPRGVYQYYQRLIELRKKYPVIIDGDFQLLSPDDPYTFSYLRRTKTDTLLVTSNFTEHERSVAVDSNPGYRLILSNYEDKEKTTPESPLRGYETRVWLAST
ncbi:alpha,alpha-phosphotrehalase [Corynebacterium poyangense]|uniref:Alpha,alpha-phosphotrehalase n=1 Tax=Corynebacterium poyangense TaxID=2684405 RepID=A0A7H0SRL1_9CORY|nr:alpha-glucosidase [Corynebacterium poyangense]MBZ8176618.1 alpha,alpha-phosphotrehalase [Corynebacterium poyangense]QNQ91186.1 alpha,alpha-phosphotrehalase [Corynebacterium poyangense]